MSELDLNRIREDYSDHDQWCPIESQGICTCPKGVIDDLLRAVEQLTRMARLLLSTMNEFGQEKYLNTLDPDIRELVENK